MHDLAEIVRSYAWPLTVLVVLFSLKQELRAFVDKLTDIISNAVSISVGAKGVEIKLREKISAANARVTALQAAQEQMVSPAARAGGRRTKKAAQAGTEELPPALVQLAREYVDLNISNHSERVSRKNALAREMGDVVLANDVSRERLAGDEVLLVALAAAITVQPEAEDLARVIDASNRVKRLHVRYRLVVALTVLISKGFVTKSNGAAVKRVFDSFRVGADPPLDTLIQEAESLLNAVLSGEVSTEV